MTIRETVRMSAQTARKGTTVTRTRIAAFALVALFALAGCAETVDGSGSEVQVSSSGGTDFPTDSTPTSSLPTFPSSDTSTPVPTPTTSSSGSSPSPNFRCPQITYASARMTFNCLSNDMKVQTGGKVFSISMAQTVETSSQLEMEMGAMLYSGTRTSFPAISSEIRLGMISQGYYGTNPTYDLDGVNYSTIDGYKAYTTADTITYNPTWARSAKTAAKTEKRWLVIIQLDTDRYTLWFASVPDLAKQYWPQVQAAINSIQINE